MKKYHVILISIVCAIPYIIYLFKNASCGWDCGFYIYHLGRTNIDSFHTWIEPLYFWIFKPFVMLGADPIIVMKVGMIAMLIASMFGVYILSRRIGLSKGESILSMVIFSMSLATMRLWGDTLRNFLSFTILPYFIYFYLGEGKKDRSISYVLIIMMALSHRLVLIIFPIIWIYNIIGKRYGRLIMETLIFALPIIIVYLFIKENISYGGLLSPVLNLIKLEDITSNFMMNLNWLRYFNGIGLITAMMGIAMTQRHQKGFKFMGIMFIVFSICSLFFNHIVAGRLILMIGIPIAILTMAFYHNSKEKKPLLSKIFIAMILIGYSILGLSAMLNSEGSISKEDMDFIKSIDIPKGSTLISPSRLTYYVRYKYEGIKPNSTNPLVLKHSKQNVY